MKSKIKNVEGLYLMINCSTSLFRFTKHLISRDLFSLTIPIRLAIESENENPNDEQLPRKSDGLPLCLLHTSTRSSTEYGDFKANKYKIYHVIEQ